MPIIKPLPFDYEAQKKYIEQLSAEYPFIEVSVVSRTCLGRGIFSLSIGSKKNSVLLAGGFHGSEWISCLVLLRFIERLSFCIKNKRQMRSVDASRAFSALGVTVIPCVNPDGTEIAVHGPDSARSLRRFVENIGCDDFSRWNANALGVDINHNFNAGFAECRRIEEENGIMGPASRQYGGRYPESEAETKALTRLCRVRHFRQVMAVHSQGEELYWKYGENTPHQSSMMAKILADACRYTLVQNSSLASHGGFKDWFIEEFARPGFTLEVGRGVNPLPAGSLQKFMTVWRRHC